MMLTGLDVLVREAFTRLRGKRVGLVTHPAALSASFETAADLFAAAPGVTLAALFGPEHGIRGDAQDLISVPGDTARRVYSLYGDTVESLRPTPTMLRGLDVLVIDLQDVGSRYYTFQATMLYCLEVCAMVGLPVTVLDRPNPLGRAVEGPRVAPGFESFVGPHSVSIRHGMTMGELARFYRAERVPGVTLDVVEVVDWHPARPAAPIVVPPSPNMPTVETAFVYPGMCLIEGTNLSEGRGTTRPFEYVGHPAADGDRIAAALNSHGFPGVRAVPVTFRPTFHKFAGQSCGGILTVVTDRESFRPVKWGLEVLSAFRDALGSQFRWRTETYEFVDKHPAIDILFGSARERLALEAGTPWAEIFAAWAPEEAGFRERRKKYLLYPE